MFTTLLMMVMLHPVHETVAEVEWNAATGRVEVALRLDVIDEQTIHRKSLLPSAAQVDAALDYLRRTFRVEPRPAKDQHDSSTYRWVGRNEEGSHVWWYFEIVPGDGERPDWIENRMLFDEQKNYTHRILFVDSSVRRGVNLNHQRPRADFPPAADESASSPATDR